MAPVIAKQLMLDGSAEETPAKDEFSSYLAISAAEGGLMGAAPAATVLGVSNQAIQDLISRGKLRSWEFFGKTLVSARDVQQRRNSPRERGGRPRKQAA